MQRFFRRLGLVTPFLVGLFLVACNRTQPEQLPAEPTPGPTTTALPAEFELTYVTRVSGGIMDLAWTPDGRMLIPTKGGRLRVYKNGSLLSTPAIDLSGIMCANGERAMGDVAVHPNFASNGYVYIYYTYNKYGTCNESEINGPVNRLSRFTMTGDVINPATELVLMDTPPLYRDHHNAGDLAFGRDSFLYVTVGDGGTARFNWPADPGRLLGKIVRLTDSGGIPPGNPFTGPDSARCNVDGVPPAGSPTGTKCQEVFSLGLRNPFRFAFDPNAPTTRYFINDVGQHSWEEISEGPVAGGNYGWPTREGPCVKDSTTDCAPPAGLVDPVHWYGHVLPDGGAITGGAFVPNGIWPSQYDGAYLFAEYVFGKIHLIKPSGSGCRSCTPPTSAYTQTEFANAARVVGMAFGPHGNTQALYYTSRENGEIWRIAYVGAANRAPTAVINANPTGGPPPLDVQFDGRSSTDPDGDTLSYAWDFQSDGTVDSTEAAPRHTYAAAGTFTASLTVRDGKGGENTATIRIDVGNMPPVPVIETPLDGATFFVGQVITLKGSATDPEDGALADTALTWEVRRHHSTHWHPWLDPTSGNNLTVTGPEPEDLEAATNSHIEILLTATDKNGLSATVSRIVMPRKVNLSFATSPTGLNLSLDETVVTAPITVVSWEKHNLRVDAPDQSDASGTAWIWESWSDGGAKAHAIAVPSSSASYSATFKQAQTSTVTLYPSDDATIRQDKPSSNYGTATAWEIDASPVRDALLRFDVSSLGGASVTSAKLRLYNVDGSDMGGTFVGTSNTSWSERTVTWNNAPAGNGPTLGRLAKVSAGSWYEVDVTPLFSGSPTAIGIRISSTSANGAAYTSREGSDGFRPQLVVTAGSSGSNSRPVADDVPLTTNEDSSASWTPAVRDAENDPLTCSIDSQPVNGTATVAMNCSSGSYSPNPNFHGSDSFSYRVSDGSLFDTGTVSVTVNPVNDPPVANSQSVSTSQGAALTITLTGSDIDGDCPLTFSVVSQPAGGSLGSPSNGQCNSGSGSAQVIYTPSAGFSGSDSFTFRASDPAGGNSPAATVTVTVSPAPSTLTFNPVADAYVTSAFPSANYGRATSIRVDNDPFEHILLKFDVSGVGARQVTRAVLRLYNTNSSNRGGDVYRVLDTSWSETGVNWTTAPAAETTRIASLGRVDPNNWYELDVTPIFTGDGTTSIKITSTSADGAWYSSREGSFKPELVLTIGGSN